MEEIKVLISEEEIKTRIDELSKQIMKDYGNKEIYAIGILTGAVYFTTDLTRKINNKINLQFMKVSSYGSNKFSNGKPVLEYDLKTSIKDKEVLIIEDIADSGITLDYIIKYLLSQEPKCLKVCVLLDKEVNKKHNIKYDYVGFKIKDEFVLGYGLDYDNKYRNIPYIGYIENK